MTSGLAPTPCAALSDRERLDWLRLTRSQNVGPATFLNLIEHFGSASDALEALPELSGRSGGGKTIRIASVADAEREIAALDKLGGRVICLGEPNYPAALAAADLPPPVLTLRGGASILQEQAIAFVGSRNASLAGIRLTKVLAREVGNAGYATVSGLARGIDSAAHEATLEGGTIAVFAGGVDHIYPTENRRLAAEIVDCGGALVSEMPLGWKPRARDFPRRNRIVAGIALGLVVVEAARRSGSLISARLANEMGRLVFAVPGSPLDPRSAGTNQLIRQGATLVTGAADILEGIQPLVDTPRQSALPFEPVRETGSLTEPDDGDRRALLEALSHTPTDIDDIMRHSGIAPGKLQSLILSLELAGMVERHAGNRISLR